MKFLFFVRSANYDRHFETVLRLLGERGHHVHVAFDVLRETRPGELALFDALCSEYPTLSYGLVPARRDERWAAFARTLRLSVDYLRYFEADYADATALRERAARRAPLLLTRALALPGGSSRPVRRALGRVLRAAEAAVPVDPAIAELVEEHDPDAVLVTPLVGLGSVQGEYVRAAREAGRHSALLVASWDNLTNKGVVRDVPDLTIVWNEPQVDEAVHLHGIPRERVVAAGAHTYDHWFAWKPSTTREEFCARVGLDPAKPFILYAGSSSFIAPNEGATVKRWLAALRHSGHPELAGAEVLVRPHPANPQAWAGVDLDVPMWPSAGGMPTTVERKRDYFDSLHHCAAVVAINTSTLIESTIAGRPVFTYLSQEYRATQEGTLHFAHLRDVLVVGRTLDEHFDQLAGALRDPAAEQERLRRFLERFVRPRGLDTPAAPVVADALEGLAAKRPRPAAERTALTRALAPLALTHQRISAGLRFFGLRFMPRRGAPQPAEGKRFVFALDHPGLLIHFDETLRRLAARGHTIHLAFGRRDKWDESLAVLDGADGRVIPEAKPALRRLDVFANVARSIRAGTDYVHYLAPALEGAPYARAKRREAKHVPRAVRRLKPTGRRRARALLRAAQALEHAIPGSSLIERHIARVQPDAVVVSPMINHDGYQTDMVKAARKLNIPSALAVASWDNLSSKGRIRLTPDRVIVWNETQRAEAVDMHGVPPERIRLTGAQPFDRWFDRAPSTDPEEFRERHDLPPRRPYVLFAGSTRQGLDPHAEARFARTLIEHLRAAEDPIVRDLAVLVRPHPTTHDAWEDSGLDELEAVSVWRRDHPLPIGETERDAYYDSLFHSAAVTAVNSSAMIEAAILGRPVHTVALPEFHSMQGALLHYHYLLPVNGGFLREATSFDEHVRLLANDLHDPEPTLARQRAFVARFIGAGAATDALVEELERLAQSTPEAQPRDPLAAALAPLVAGAALQDLARRVLARYGPPIIRRG